jgi:hypothetical protein
MVNIQKGRRVCFSILNDTLQLRSLTIAHNEESVVRARLQLLPEFRFLLGLDQRIREHGVNMALLASEMVIGCCA